MQIYRELQADFMDHKHAVEKIIPVMPLTTLGDAFCQTETSTHTQHYASNSLRSVLGKNGEKNKLYECKLAYLLSTKQLNLYF